MTGAPNETLRSLWTSLSSDKAAMRAMNDRADQRRRVTPEILAFIDSFVAGTIDVERLRRDFDLKTRTEWTGFGLKGLSGAMVLNKLVNHLPQHRHELEAELRRAFALPTDDAGALAQMRAFTTWIASLIDAGVTTKADIQPRRLPFLFSALWYIRAPERWPAYYESMRDRLEELALFDEGKDVVESYVHFARVVRDQTTGLGLEPWKFEFLCTYRRPAPSVPLPADPDRKARVWLWAAGRGASAWAQFKEEGIAGIGFGGAERDLREFDSLQQLRDWLQAKRADGTRPVNDALAAWEIVHDVRVGDVVYVKKGRSHIVGRGTVTGAYQFEPARKPFAHLCAMRWDWDGLVDAGEFLVMKTLTDVTDYPDLVSRLARNTDAHASEADVDADDGGDAEGDTYDLEDAARELFLPRGELERHLQTLRTRKNVILQGPPGVGKTFVASRLADLLLGRTAPGHKVTVQFHPSYAYEDFVQGYRPTASGGYERVNGPFLQLCNRALQDKAEPYVVIIDEINRAHLGKVFGELMMLIEADKRELRWATTLAYARVDEQPFYVPPNLHVIGTMNTADRSLAMVDYALRRRFAFIDLEPAFGEPAFEQHMTARGMPVALFKRIEKRVRAVNELLEADATLGSGYFLGHSFVCAPPEQPTEEWFQSVVEQDLAPLLREYWFDRKDQFERARTILLGEE